MNWPFLFKNLLFGALFMLPFSSVILREAPVKVVLLANTLHMSFAALCAWFVGVFWVLWVSYKGLVTFFRWIFGVAQESSLMTYALIALDGEEHNLLDKFFKQRRIRKKSWAFILNALYKKKLGLLEYKEALAKAALLPCLRKWVVRQKAKYELKEGYRDQGYALLKDLYQEGDKSPWLLETFLDNALFYEEIDLAQDVLYHIKKNRYFLKTRFKWEGKLLFKKALLWKGSIRKKEWLLEKALVLLPTETDIIHELVMLYVHEGEAKKAEDLVTSGWCLNPDHRLIPVACYIFEKKTKTERFESAKKMLQSQPDHPLSVFFLGACAFQAGFEPLALESANKLMSVKEVWGLFLLGLIKSRHSKTEAIKSLKKSLCLLDTTVKQVTESLGL